MIGKVRGGGTICEMGEFTGVPVSSLLLSTRRRPPAQCNASAQGAAEYAQSLAQVMLAWRVDHVHVSSAGATWEPRWLPILRAFAVNFNRTAGNKRTLAIRGPGGSTDPLLSGSELLDELRGLADSVAAGPPLWDTWPHVRSALILAKEEWRRVSHSSCGDQQPCARWDIGVLPIGRLGAVQGGNMTYPPWHAGSCTPVQLGCGDAVSAAPTVIHAVSLSELAKQQRIAQLKLSYLTCAKD